MTNSRSDFSHELASALEQRGISAEQLTAQLVVRGVRTTPKTLTDWIDGSQEPARSRDLALVRATEQVLHLPDGTLVGAMDRGSRVDWDPMVALPPDHPARTRLAGLRNLTRQHFTKEVLTVTVRLHADRRTLEQTVRLLYRPTASVSHEPSTVLLVPRGSQLETVHSPSRMQLLEPVVVDDRLEMVLATARRSAPTRPGRLVHTEATFRVTAPHEIDGAVMALRAPAQYATFGVTFQGELPSEVSLARRRDWGSRPEVTALQPAFNVQHTAVQPTPGLYEFSWR